MEWYGWGLLWLLWNGVVFLVYGLDKWQARRDGPRVRERTLLLLAFCMGAAGALFGMHLFRHKTKHLSFRILVPLGLLCNILIIGGGIWLVSWQMGERTRYEARNTMNHSEGSFRCSFGDEKTQHFAATVCAGNRAPYDKRLLWGPIRLPIKNSGQANAPSAVKSLGIS